MSDYDYDLTLNIVQYKTNIEYERKQVLVAKKGFWWWKWLVKISIYLLYFLNFPIYVLGHFKTIKWIPKIMGAPNTIGVTMMHMVMGKKCKALVDQAIIWGPSKDHIL